MKQRVLISVGGQITPITNRGYMCYRDSFKNIRIKQSITFGTQY